MVESSLSALTKQVKKLGNASSLHSAGRSVRKDLEAAREELAAAAGCAPSEIIFTSTGTEANNLAIKGLFWNGAKNNKKVIIWGHKFPIDTYFYIQNAYHRASNYIGYETYWFDDNDDISAFDFSNSKFLSTNDCFNALILSIDDFVNLFLLASSENPPDKVAPLKEHLFIKKYNYKHQLMFYKILLENSRTYRDKNVKFGIINFVDSDENLLIKLDFENDISKDEFKLYHPAGALGKRL